MSAVEIIAHRGAGAGFVQPDTAPENTLPALAYAWSRQVDADAAECDIHQTKDGVIVVIHDSTTNRTTNAGLVVAEHDYASLSRLDAGSWKAPAFSGIRIPTLEEVIETIPAGKRLFTEIKTGPRIVNRLEQVVVSSGKLPEQVALISFNIDSIRSARQRLPEHECYLLVSFEYDPAAGRWIASYEEGPAGQAVSQAADPAGLDTLVELVKQAGLNGIDLSVSHPPGLLVRMRQNNLKPVVWTVNDLGNARHMIDNGVRSITTDIPMQMRAAFRDF